MNNDSQTMHVQQFTLFLETNNGFLFSQ